MPEPATEPSARARELVRGAYDLHVHVEPDLAQRRIDDLSLARRFGELGLAGFVLKSHYAPTAERAAVVRAAVPGVRRARRDRAQRRRRRAERAGGRDRRARRRADRLAADGRLRERGERGRPEARQAAGLAQIQDEFAAAGVASEPVRLTRERPRARARGRRAPRARARDRHLGRAEIHTRRRRRARGRSRAGRRDAPRLPDAGRPRRRAAALAERGALLERCFAPIHTGKVSWEQTFEAIRATGPRTQRPLDRPRPGGNPPVEDGLALMADRLLEAGFSEDEVRTMAVVNTRRLAGA